MISPLAAHALHKYVDDTNLSELVQPEQPHTHMSTYLTDLHTWAAYSGMEINTSKTKEMLLDPLYHQPTVAHNLLANHWKSYLINFKLLGVHLNSSLAWSTHINHITKKNNHQAVLSQATQKSWFVQQSPTAFLYNSHSSCTWILCTIVALCVNQSTVWEPTGCSKACHPYRSHPRPWDAIFIYAFYANLSSLASRREDLSCKFFCHIADAASCLHSLLPPPRPLAVTSRLRSPQSFPKVHTRTKRYCSFIQYGRNHYQHKIK